MTVGGHASATATSLTSEIYTQEAATLTGDWQLAPQRGVDRGLWMLAGQISGCGRQVQECPLSTGYCVVSLLYGVSVFIELRLISTRTPALRTTVGRSVIRSAGHSRRDCRIVHYNGFTVKYAAVCANNVEPTVYVYLAARNGS